MQCSIHHTQYKTHTITPSPDLCSLVFLCLFFCSTRPFAVGFEWPYTLRCTVAVAVGNAQSCLAHSKRTVVLHSMVLWSCSMVLLLLLCSTVMALMMPSRLGLYRRCESSCVHRVLEAWWTLWWRKDMSSVERARVKTSSWREAIIKRIPSKRKRSQLALPWAVHPPLCP